MKSVVFGGSGFLGSHVADALTEKGHEVIIFDKKVSEYLIEGKQRFIQGDILDVDAVCNAVNGSNIVYNYAGMASLDDAATRPIDTVMQNVVGSCNVMDACVRHSISRYVYASSFYANSDKGGFYRCSKQSAEIYIEEYSRRYGLEYTILRYGSLYGPRSDKGNGIRRMLIDAIKDGVIHYSGSGDETREYIHVKDAAELSVQILNEEYKNRNIVLTGHDTYKVKDITKLIGEILDKDITVEYGNRESELHYDFTPYTYKPKQNYKLVSNLYHDIGQGLIECLEDVERNKDNR